MTKYIFFQAFTETVNGITKGSMKRILMFMLCFTGCGIAVISVRQITPQNVLSVIALIGTLFSPMLILGGYALSAQNTDTKNTTPNPNLPPK